MQNKLKVYLAPFLHGMRYTSFGRHFTKVEKLEEIMGLNPPFGVKASLANKFIDKALEFNPKILILIVPPETQR
ncbi:hypothetical protein ACE6H2_015057 [Prunus campanulata]